MTDAMNIAAILPVVLVAALVIDLIAGDPERLPHPVRWTGRVITLLEGFLARPASPAGKRLGGAILAIIVVGGVFLVSALVLFLSLKLSPALFLVIAVYIAWTSISVKELKKEAEGVLSPLSFGDIKAARKRLSRIVGRDTDSLDEKGIIKATAETIAENTSDGIIAPIFYLAAGGPVVMLIAEVFWHFGQGGPGARTAFYLAGGPALMAAYKAVNTLDSMVGYRSEQYMDFGRFSARLDDLANYIPSRLTALLMVAASMILRQSWRRSAAVLIRDGRNHPSPNAGLPEAALAGALGLKFGGPASYGGIKHAKPHIGDDLNEVCPGAVRSSIMIMLLSTLLMVALTLLVHLGFLL
jgi:adenosylcobinamide-phosphate synthase